MHLRCKRCVELFYANDVMDLTSYRIRISDYPINAPFVKADIFLSLDKKSNEKYLTLLKEDGIILDEHQTGKRIINVPFVGIAQQTFQNKLFANVVAVGALSAVIGIDPDSLNKVISSQFSRKSEDIVSKNIAAAAEGYRSARKNCEGICSWILPKIEQQYYLISGNEALALGAAAAGCRFMAAYPMTPSTGIITYLSKHKDRLKIFTEQAEDEIAAINMAIGASYAGVRSMTASSGGNRRVVEGIIIHQLR